MTVSTESEKIIDSILENMRGIAQLRAKQGELQWEISKQLHTLKTFLSPVDKKDE